jgi:hypothetical protein
MIMFRKSLAFIFVGALSERPHLAKSSGAFVGPEKQGEARNEKGFGYRVNLRVGVGG